MQATNMKKQFVFVDTNIFYSKAAVDALIRRNQKERKTILLPEKIKTEIQHGEDREKMKNCLKRLKKLAAENDVRIVKDERKGMYPEGEKRANSHLDPDIVNYVQKISIVYPIEVLTSDRNLARDLQQLKLNTSYHPQWIEVCEFKDGEFVPHPDYRFVYRRKSGKRMKTHEKIRLNEDLHVSKDNKMPAFGEPVVVWPDKKVVFLGTGISEGAEGVLYSMSSPLEGYVAKIWKPVSRTEVSLKRTLLWKIIKNCPANVLRPEKILLNKNGEAIGYLMKKAPEDARSLSETILNPDFMQSQKPYCMWGKENLVKICIEIAETMRQLHDQQVLMGDISAGNIMVDQKGNVYFIDCDSYQICNQYPSPVATPETVPPELYDCMYGRILRSVSSENYGIAVLFFQILMGGILPFQRKGGESMREMKLKYSFVYPYGETAQEQFIPSGNYRYYWAHLPDCIKELFFETFSSSRSRKGWKNRPNLNAWKQALERYLSDIQTEEVSEEMYPLLYPGQELCAVKFCERCGTIFGISSEEKVHPKMCRDCRGGLS